ncbi:MAG TPA: flagellar export chaperone FliS [Terracidiphilus sp.]|jgi:flagellar biosynthetic protein FliS|nr:flagellar export chaperone FliS [Terracidiphilus sp.]
MTRIDLAYRKTAVEGASGFGLLVALFDTLAVNIQRAAEAERANDIEKRSYEMKHALLVIGCLEDWASRGPGGELADQLEAFYKKLRHSLVQAQVQRSAPLMEQQMASVLRLRQCWQQADVRCDGAGPDVLRPMNGLDFAAMQSETRHSNWSA